MKIEDWLYFSDSEITDDEMIIEVEIITGIELNTE